MTRLTVLCAISLMLFVSMSESTPIPKELKGCVAFIFVGPSKDSLSPNGTAFFVRAASSGDSSAPIFLVTAKHVLQDATKRYFRRVWVRLNKRGVGADTLLVELFTKAKPLFQVHPDSTVDIAVVPSPIPIALYDHSAIAESLITTDEIFRREDMREGDDVFFTGLFTHHYGTTRNIPIVRFGKVALISQERVLWDSVLTDLYLIETTSFGGNSGSPLFFYFDVTRDPGFWGFEGPRLFLAGIVKGYFGEPTQFRIIETKGRIPWPIQNSGIAAVVPAHYLYDILHPKTTLRQDRRLK